MSAYYWISFIGSLYCLLQTPSEQSVLDNISGSIICAMFGFILWPLFVIAYIKTRKSEP